MGRQHNIIVKTSPLMGRPGRLEEFLEKLGFTCQGYCWETAEAGISQSATALRKELRTELGLDINMVVIEEIHNYSFRWLCNGSKEWNFLTITEYSQNRAIEVIWNYLLPIQRDTVSYMVLYEIDGKKI